MPPVPCFRAVKGRQNEDARFFIPCKNHLNDFVPSPIDRRGLSPGIPHGVARLRTSWFSLFTWTRRTAADAATWVAPTCCSERVPRQRDRRIGCMGDLTRKTASRPLDTHWDDSFSRSQRARMEGGRTQPLPGCLIANVSPLLSKYPARRGRGNFEPDRHWL